MIHVSTPIGLLTMSTAIGLVGPKSNYAAMAQLVETVPYRSRPYKGPQPDDPAAQALVDVAAIQSFADTLGETNKGKWLHVDRLGGFCLMIKRAVCKQMMQQGELDKGTDLAFSIPISSVQKPRNMATIWPCAETCSFTTSVRGPLSTDRRRRRRGKKM